MGASMPVVAHCPKTEDYRQMLAGALPAAEQSSLCGHLETCADCTGTVKSLLDDDTFSLALQTATLPEAPPVRLVDTLLSMTIDALPAQELKQLGPYTIRKKLGQGGMGIVYLADDARLERPVALKIMRPTIAGRESAQARFLREARAAAKIKSEHVVTIHQAGEENGIAYVAMEVLHGVALSERLQSQTPSVTDSISFARQMALGLAAAHAQGLVHRDIKPENVWLETPNDHVKLLDFGLARPIDTEVHLTNAGAIVGTPAFMAPEQAAGQRVDARSDLFSLGAVLYRMVTGKLPFPGGNVMEVLHALANTTPTRAGSLNPAVPPALDGLIARLLAKSADARPATAAAVAKELESIAANPQQGVPWSRRRWLAVASVVPVMGAAGYFAIAGSRSENQPDPEPLPPAPYRELFLPPKATMFVGNFTLDPARTLTVEGFVTFDADAFDATGADQIMASNCFSLFGSSQKWSLGYRMLAKADGKTNEKFTHFGNEQILRRGHRYHIAAVHYGPQLRLYLDGRIIAGENIGHDWKFIESSYFCLGGGNLPMRFDEVRVSTIARYQANFTPAERHTTDEHTFALYHLDESEGFVVTDSSGHGRHGNNHGGEWVSTPR